MNPALRLLLAIVLLPITILACIVLGLLAGFSNPVKTRNDV